MARKEVWVWSGSSQEHHVVPGGNQARVVCSVPSPPTLHLFAQREEKAAGLLACNSCFLRSSNSLLLPLALSDGDRLGRQRVHCEARQSYFSVYLLKYVTFIQARLSQNWI